MIIRGALLAVFVVTTAGCGGDDMATDDAGAGAPDANLACPDPTVALPTGWLPVAMVSAGAVTSVADHGVITSSIDATAGGFGGSANEPFVYVKFGAAGTLDKVAITDVQSYTSSDWDLAFKRYVIRANGGDSGPGGVSVAAQDGATLDVVALPPAAGAFHLDDWATADCQPIIDGLGAPVTSIGVWYSMTGMTLDPLAKIYVVKRPDGSYFKLRVVTYYGDPADATRSAFFSIEWAPL